MKELIGYCGLVCTTCPIYVATRENNDVKRKEISMVIARDYHHVVEPSAVNCDGCTSENDRLFIGGRNCEIRKCGQKKGVKNCGYCAEYVCEKLANFPEFSDSCRRTLDEIKSGMR